jgi:nucleotide-binding universal stress UspA family protein
MNRIATSRENSIRTPVADGREAGTTASRPGGDNPTPRLFQWKCILVPVDYRESSVTALQCASELAVASGARLIALHVVNLGRASLYDDEGRRITAGERRQLAQRELVRWLKAASLPKQIKVGPLIRFGEPVDEVIIATAHRWKADLIVTSGHARHFWQRLFDVKTTSRVVRYAPCDVYYACHNAKLPRPQKPQHKPAAVK